MGKVFVVLISVTLIGALVWFFWPEDKAVTNYPSSGTDIVAFGDSLVRGVGASSPEKNFVSTLSAKVGKPIVNLGVPGDTTADGIARLDKLDEYDPKVVLILLGGNDRLKRVPLETTEKNLSTIIEDVHRRGAVVVLLGVRGGLFNDRLEPIFEELEARYHTAYVPDVLDGLFGDPDFMDDYIHPNDAGYAIIAENIYPTLTVLLRSP